MTDLLSPQTWDVADLQWLGPFLLEHGVDLATTPSPETLESGTPVYVRVAADPVDVQKRIAQGYVRMLFVIDNGAVIGVVDTADLIQRADSLPWPVAPLSVKPADSTASVC